MTTKDQSQKQFIMPSQAESAYRSAGGTENHACSNCRWFIRGWDEPDSCHLIENYPDPIVPNGVCDRWEMSPAPEEITIDPIPVVIVEAEVYEEDSAEMMLGVPVPKSLFAKLKDLITSFVEKNSEPAEPPSFQVFKTTSGRKAWISRHTGKWIDREGEILSDQSHEDYVTRVQSGFVSPPELWMWHAKGTKHGQAVAVWKSGGFVMAAGYFDETPAGEKAFSYYQKQAGKIKLSHMFHFPPATKVNGVYHSYNTIEITTLPDGAEAFPYTSFQEVMQMSIPQAGQEMIAEALGDDVLEHALELDKRAVADSKTLDSMGVASKGYDKYMHPDQEAAMKSFDERLKALEAAAKASDGLPQVIAQMSDAIKQMSEQLNTALNAEAKTLERLQAAESKLALFSDLKPPASQSKDNLLNEREKSFLDSVIQSAQTASEKSLVETLVGEKPSIG